MADQRFLSEISGVLLGAILLFFWSNILIPQPQCKTEICDCNEKNFCETFDYLNNKISFANYQNFLNNLKVCEKNNTLIYVLCRTYEETRIDYSREKCDKFSVRQKNMKLMSSFILFIISSLFIGSIYFEPEKKKVHYENIPLTNQGEKYRV